MQKIALFGAAGAIGKSIATALDTANRSYRVVGRSTQSLGKAFGKKAHVELATWNPDDSNSVRDATRGIDTLIYLVGVPYDQFHLHPLLMKKTLDAAIAEGVERIVLIGTVYPYGMPTTKVVREDHPRNPNTYKGKMRKEQEEILLKAHTEGKIQATILRLPDFYGPGVEKSFLHSLFQSAVKGGTANMVGPIDRPHEFVYVPDVGPVVTALAENKNAYGRWWNLAGYSAITQKEIAEQVFALAGRETKIRVAGKTTLRLLGLVNPMMRELVEMHYLLTTPVLMEDRALEQLLGKLQKTSYLEGLRQTLSSYQQGEASSV